jgi:hypothetical protein
LFGVLGGCFAGGVGAVMSLSMDPKESGD